MERFSVVVFRLMAPAKSGAYRETGGGVAFLADPRPDDWHGLVADLVRARFAHTLGPCVEVGSATLDRAMLERHCQRHGTIFWQGGDG